MAGESFPPDVLDLCGADDRAFDVLETLAALEQFGDFCMNTRRGLPIAAVHLLRRTLAERFPERWRNADGALPMLAGPPWHGGATSGRLAEEFIGATWSRRLRQVSDLSGARKLLEELGRVHQEDLAERVDRYPAHVPVPYRERWQGAQLGFSVALRRRIAQAAEDLGVAGETLPVGSAFDHAVVLGGGGRSPLLRAAYLAELLSARDVSVGSVWFLGSPRPIDESDERAIIEAYAVGAADEFDLMTAAAEQSLGVVFGTPRLLCGCDELSAACPQWLARMAAIGHDHDALETTDPYLTHERVAASEDAPKSVTVVSAATSRPGTRPNTADTYALLGRLAHLGEGSTCLVVTTQIFVPFQTFDALRMLTLEHGAAVEVVGFGAERGDRPRSAELELQEVLSGIRSARRLTLAAARKRQP